MRLLFPCGTQSFQSFREKKTNVNVPMSNNIIPLGSGTYVTRKPIPESSLFGIENPRKYEVTQFVLKEDPDIPAIQPTLISR